MTEDNQPKMSQFLAEIKGSDYDIYYLLKLILGKTYERVDQQKAREVRQYFLDKLVLPCAVHNFANSADILLGIRNETCHSSSEIASQFGAAQMILECFGVSSAFGLHQLHTLKEQFYSHEKF